MSRTRILFLLSIGLTLLSCKDNKLKFIDVLPGEWEVYSFEVDDKGREERTVKAAAKLAQSVRYDFHDDFTYTIFSLSYPEGRLGKWSYLPNENTLNLRMGGELQEVNISRFDERSMAFIRFSPKFGKVQTLLRKIE